MIAEQFDPSEIECLVRTAAELWERAGTADADLSEKQQAVLDRARTALLADFAGHEPASPQRTTLLGAGAPVQVYVLRRWDRSDEEVTLHATRQAAQHELAAWTRQRWANANCRDEAPTPPEDDQEAIDLYYGPPDERDDDDYRLYPEEVQVQAPAST